MTNSKTATRHGHLQSMLTHLASLNPRTRRPPLFSSRDAAEHMIAISATTAGTQVALTPVWVIDHDDLLSSEVVAWTVTPQIN